jgi:hypothetical protein
MAQQATLINQQGNKVVVDSGSPQAQQYFGQGYQLMGPTGTFTAPTATATPTTTPTASPVAPVVPQTAPVPPVTPTTPATTPSANLTPSPGTMEEMRLLINERSTKPHRKRRKRRMLTFQT